MPCQHEKCRFDEALKYLERAIARFLKRGSTHVAEQFKCVQQILCRACQIFCVNLNLFSDVGRGVVVLLVFIRNHVRSRRDDCLMILLLNTVKKDLAKSRVWQNQRLARILCRA